MTRQLLVTGGAGFIGSHFIEHILDTTSYQITNVDALSYAGKLANVQPVSHRSNYRFICCDISDKLALAHVFDRTYDVIINFAAESHVDRSINNAYPFIQTNVTGTLHLLNAVLEGKAKKLVQISTDEVYGTLQENEPSFTERSPLLPNNPYAASKASADLLVRSFYQTYKVPVIITRCSNNFGPRQHDEKFIPTAILAALQNKPIPLYGDGLQKRDWLFVKDHCRALALIIEKGNAGEIYNIGTGEERTNIAVATEILHYLRKDNELIEYVTDRKGHDRRYSIDSSKLRNSFQWKPLTSFSTGLAKTIEWYRQTYFTMLQPSVRLPLQDLK